MVLSVVAYLSHAHFSHNILSQHLSQSLAPTTITQHAHFTTFYFTYLKVHDFTSVLLTQTHAAHFILKLMKLNFVSIYCFVPRCRSCSQSAIIET